MFAVLFMVFFWVLRVVLSSDFYVLLPLLGRGLPSYQYLPSAAGSNRRGDLIFYIRAVFGIGVG